MTLKIGNLVLQGNVILAPMAGVTDLPFRILCREYGASFACTEMVSAKAIVYHNKRTEELMETGAGDEPLAVQLFGSDPDIMAEAACMVEENFAVIDVNMGCPVPKIVKNGEGSCLMTRPELAARILRAMVKSCGKPVTVKFRKGFREDSVNAVEFARMAEDAGVAALTIHGRTREQYYSGKADWNIIKKVKDAVSIPVFGNGDVFSPEDGRRMLEETGVDGIALARGVKGNPWLLKQIIHYLSTGELLPPPCLEERKAVMRRHMKLMEDHKGAYIATLEMRKHLSWYTAGLPGSSRLRDELNHAATLEELRQIIDSLE